MDGENSYLVFLEWPEKCFRVDAASLKYLRTLVSPKAKIVRARTERAFLRHLQDATHVITWHFLSEWFKLAPRLKVLATPAAGREFVAETGPKGVKIHFGEFQGRFMAESVAAFMLGWCRGFFRPQPSIWPRTWMSERCYDLAGTKAVILGYGRVGKLIGEKLSALGVKVLGITRHNGALPKLLSRQPPYDAPDWLVSALPGGRATDKLINARLLAKLPRQCVLINVGRGNAVDEPALFAALKAHRLAGAYLDVRATEPVARLGNKLPPVPPKLDNLILMPHASAFSPNYCRACFSELKEKGLLK